MRLSVIIRRRSTYSYMYLSALYRMLKYLIFMVNLHMRMSIINSELTCQAHERNL